MVRFVQGCGAYLKVMVDLERLRDGVMHAFWINLGHVRIFLLVDVFVPNRDAQFRTHESKMNLETRKPRKRRKLTFLQIPGFLASRLPFQSPDRRVARDFAHGFSE